MSTYQSLLGLSLFDADVINVTTINAVDAYVTTLHVDTIIFNTGSIINVSSTILPSTNGTYNLGSLTKQFAVIWTQFINSTILASFQTANIAIGSIVTAYIDQLYAVIPLTQITLHTNIIPDVTNSYNLGSTLIQFNNIYSKNIVLSDNIYAKNVYISEQLTAGTQAPVVDSTVTFNSLPGKPYVLAFIDSITALDAQFNAIVVNIASTIAPTSSTNIMSSYFTNALYNTFPGSLNTLATCFHAYPLVTATSSTITTFSSFYNEVGILFSGTVTNAYGAYFHTPSFGTNKNALYADDLSIGYIGISPGTGNAIISNQLAVATNTPIPAAVVTISTFASASYNMSINGTLSTLDGSSNLIAIYCTTIMQPSSAASNVIIYNANNTFNLLSNITFAASYQSKPFIAGISTITTYTGFYADGGSTSGGTVTNAYGAYFKTPTFGTNKIALYSDNLSIGFTGVSPSTGTLIISNQLAVNTNTPNANAIVTLFASTTRAYNLLLNGTINTVDGSSNAYAVNNITSIFLSSGGNIVSAYSAQCSYSMTAFSTTPIVSSYYASPTISGPPFTITNYSNYYSAAGSLSGGTVTSAYGGFFNVPGFGTNRNALYTNDLSVGYTSITPGTGVAVISNQLGIRTSSPNSNTVVELVANSSKAYAFNLTGTLNAVVGGNDQFAINNTITFTPTGGGLYTSAFFDNGIYSPAGSDTMPIAASFHSRPQISGTGTVGNYIGFYAHPGSILSGTPTITNSFGAFFTQPSFGTFACALYADQISIGVTSIAFGTGNLYLSNNIVLSQSSGTNTTSIYAQVSASNVTFALPINNGSVGNVLVTDGSGLTSWSASSTPNIIMGTSAGSASTSSTTYVQTALAATITLSTVTSKVLIHVSGTLGVSATYIALASVDRNGTDLSSGLGLASTGLVTTGNATCSFTYLDSPTSTSALTYTVGYFVSNALGTAYWNNTGTLTTIILEEIFT